MVAIIELKDVSHLQGMGDLFAQNWAETGFDFETKPNFEAIERLIGLGFMFILIAVSDDKIIGYSSAMVTPHLYNSEIVFCNSDALFVLPDWRKYSVGARLKIKTEQVAKERGAVRMLWHTRAGTKFADTLGNHDCEPADIVWMKRI